jgi:glycosyltransferase involved in cell wall biosynthesis
MVAVKLQKRIFKSLSIFSLPSMERLRYFPMDHFNGKFFFIPNYPSKDFFEPFQHQNGAPEIKIIFQGMIDRGHGFEEVISLLPLKINQRPLKLILYGPVSKKYKKELEALVEKKGVSNEVSFYDLTPYQEVPHFSRKCHIGMAVFTKGDIMNSTRATASNKIYEYAALGLPVLYYDNAHYRKYLGQYNWAIPTNLSKDSLLKAFNFIMDNYTELSASARQSFLEEANYEQQFEQVVDYLNSNNE